MKGRCLLALFLALASIGAYGQETNCVLDDKNGIRIEKDGPAIVIPSVKSYNSWAKVCDDEGNGRYLVVYGSGPDHAGNSKDVRLAVLVDDTVVNDVVIATGASNQSYKPIGIFKQEDKYIVMATYAEGGNVDTVKSVRRYESRDLVKWNEVSIDFPILYTGNKINIDNVSLVDDMIFISQSNYESGAYATSIMRSRDGGLTFDSRTVGILPDTSPCEMIFFRVMDRIVCLGRRNLFIKSEAEPLSFCYSDDYGDTWSKMEDAGGVMESNSSNLSAIKLSDDKMLIMYCSRRCPESAGIYYSISDIDGVYEGRLDDGFKLIDGTADSNFGYPFVFRHNGNYYVAYYEGPSSSVASVKIQRLELL